MGTGGGEGVELRGSDFGRAAPETAVGGQQVRGNLNLGHTAQRSGVPGDAAGQGGDWSREIT